MPLNPVFSLCCWWCRLIVTTIVFILSPWAVWLLSSYWNLSRSSYFLKLIPCLFWDLASAFRSSNSTFYRHKNLCPCVCILCHTTPPSTECILCYGHQITWNTAEASKGSQLTNKDDDNWHLPVYCGVTSKNYSQLWPMWWMQLASVTRPGRIFFIIGLEGFRKSQCLI